MERTIGPVLVLIEQPLLIKDLKGLVYSTILLEQVGS